MTGLNTDDSLQPILDRIIAGTHTETDLAALRRALQVGQITLASGERAVAIGGSVSDVIIVTGDGNVVTVFRGSDATALQSALGETMAAMRRDEHDRECNGSISASSSRARPLNLEELAFYENRYLEQVRESCGQLYSEGIDDRKTPLTDVFILLEAVHTVEHPRADTPLRQERVEEMGVKEKGSEEHGESRDEQPLRQPERTSAPVPLSAALQQHRHLVILGDPGSGKTTTLQFIALRCASPDWQHDSLGLSEGAVPVLMGLREYGYGPLRDELVKYLEGSDCFAPALPDNRRQISWELFSDWWAKGRLILLLDGLDEVASARREKVAQSIREFARTPEGRRCRIVVTSRTAGYRATRELGGDSGLYTLQPFAGANDALLYARKWLQAVGRDKEKAEAEAERLLSEMEQRSGLARIIGNPLLLRLAIAVYAQQQEFAKDRADLYRRYVDEVIMAREKARPTPGAHWTHDQILEALEAIAWTLQTEGPKTGSALAGLKEVDTSSAGDGQALVEHLRERVGLLTTYLDGNKELVAFRHLTFREYFVAQRLAKCWQQDRERTWRYLRPRLHHPDWREPVLLMVAMVGKVDPADRVGVRDTSTSEKEASELVERMFLIS